MLSSNSASAPACLNVAFGPSLDVPTSTLQGRFVKLSLLMKF